VPAIFPRWTNMIPLAAGVLGPLALAGVVGGIWYYFSPEFTDVGYRPQQPVPFSHKLHAGDMGMDCRYCHNTIERAAHAAVPPAQTCMNCHSLVKTDSPRLKLVRDSYETGEPIPWVRVHQLPDYAFFDHRPHLAAGVGCSSCHGRIDRMPIVEMAKPLSMGWCLDCHRDPEPELRPKDQITNMAWDFEVDGKAYDAFKDPARTRQVRPPEHCSGCHR
jgi:hypothetical protein